jgi:DNA-binding phage protein
MSGTISYKASLYRELQDDTFVYYYLRGALEDCRPVFRLAFQDVMEARNLPEINWEGELDRVLAETGYPMSETINPSSETASNSTSETGDSTSVTLDKILHALNLQLIVAKHVPRKEIAPKEQELRTSSTVK